MNVLAFARRSMTPKTLGGVGSKSPLTNEPGSDPGCISNKAANISSIPSAWSGAMNGYYDVLVLVMNIVEVYYS